MPPKTKKVAVSHAKPEKKASGASISKQIHESGEYDESDLKKKSSKKEVANPNFSPLQSSQFELIKGLYNFAINNYTSESFVITLLLGFLMNIMYAKYNDEFKDDIITVAFCWVGALTSYIVSYITQQRAITKAVKDGRIEADSPLATARAPSFDRLYATTLPVMICFLVRKDLLVMNLGLTYLLLELPSFIKLFISVTVMFNFHKDADVIDSTFIPALHWVVETSIDHYVAGSLSDVEKWTFATLFVNLMYAAPDNGDKILVIFKYLVYWFGGLIYVSTPILSFYRKQTNDTLKKGILLSVYIGFVSIFYFGVVYKLTPILGEHPLIWLKNFITESSLRFNIFKIWLASFFSFIPLFVKLSLNWNLQAKRKIWHLIVFGLLLYPLIVDPALVKLALIGLAGVAVLVEVLRTTKLPPIGLFLDSVLKPFQDERDQQGPIVISYIFLICGISLPVFLNNSVAGLVSLGVGDAAASVIGKHIGQVQWFESKKTMEGTVAFIFFSTAAMYLYKFLGGVDYSWNTIFMSCVFTAMLEALSLANDNLLAPAYMYLMLEVLHHIQ